MYKYSVSAIQSSFFSIAEIFGIFALLNETDMFGGGAGHIADMIARMKQNRELLKQKRYFKKHIKPDDLGFSNRATHHLETKKATRRQLQKIRDDADVENRRQMIIKTIILFVSLMILLGIIALINYY